MNPNTNKNVNPINFISKDRQAQYLSNSLQNSKKLKLVIHNKNNNHHNQKCKINNFNIKTEISQSSLSIHNFRLNPEQYYTPIKTQNMAYIKDNEGFLNESKKISVPKKISPNGFNKTFQNQKCMPERKCVKIELFKKKKADVKNIVVKQLNLTQQKNEKKLSSQTTNKKDKQQKIQLLQKLKKENEILRKHNLIQQEIHKNQIQKQAKQIEVLQAQINQLKFTQKNIKQQLKNEIDQKVANNINYQSIISNLKNTKNKYQAENNRLQENVHNLKQKTKELDNELEKLKTYNNEILLEKNNIKKICNEKQFRINQLQNKLKDNSFQLLYFSTKQQNIILQINLNRKVQQYQTLSKRHKEIINQLTFKFQQQKNYYQNRILTLEQENFNLKKYQTCIVTKQDQNENFNNNLKQKLLEIQNMKQKVKIKEEEMYILISELNAEKINKSNLQESLKVEKSKFQYEKKLIQNRYLIQLQNMVSQRVKYNNQIKNLSQKIQYLLKEKNQKNQFFKNLLKDHANGQVLIQKIEDKFLIQQSNDKNIVRQKQIIKIS